ncbi:MAG: cupin domain-containing protein [Betaproteobacteria bacterium]|nr:cupin domain-containing protein [Betaproteobacteria bacterium]
MPAQDRIVRNEFPWGVIEWLAGAEVGNSEELSLARVSMPPGSLADNHAHANCEESVYVVQGRVECTCEGRSTVLAQGELTVVPRGAAHRLRNVGSEPAEMILSYSSNAREFRLA